MERKFSTDTVLFVYFDKGLRRYQTEDYYGRYHNDYAKYISAESLEEFVLEATSHRARYDKNGLRSKIWKGLAYSQLLIVLMIAINFLITEGLEWLPFIMIIVSYLFMSIITNIADYYEDQYFKEAQRGIEFMIREENEVSFAKTGTQWLFHEHLKFLELRFPIKARHAMV